MCELAFKGLTARRLYKSFGVKGLMGRKKHKRRLSAGLDEARRQSL
jgi:hypothetical protein